MVILPLCLNKSHFTSDAVLSLSALEMFPSNKIPKHFLSVSYLVLCINYYVLGFDIRSNFMLLSDFLRSPLLFPSSLFSKPWPITFNVARVFWTAAQLA
jgi:hypothetical protein